MAKTFLLLGSNQGNRLQYLQHAIMAIKETMGKVLLASSVYESEAWGFESDQRFLNQVVLIETELSPDLVLKQIASIENKAQRRRSNNIGYESRTLDVDILFYDDQIIATPLLTIPHPRLHQRRFTLVPLLEIAPDWQHPLLKSSVKELFSQCTDKGKVWKFIGG